MNDIQPDRQERQRRFRELQKRLKRNGAMFRKLGFKPTIGTRFVIPDSNLWIDGSQCDFESLRHIVETLAVVAHQKGKDEVRQQFRDALGI